MLHVIDTTEREEGTTVTRAPKPVSLAVRLPLSLYEAIDAYAETEDVNLSEALRRLAVQALEAQNLKHTITDEAGAREDDSWKHDRLSEDDQN